ncbi:MAG: PhnD/SsuA/transferrin family substrate-binding protein [Cyanobacteria bacterium P01_A01_bin.135]
MNASKHNGTKLTGGWRSIVIAAAAVIVSACGGDRPQGKLNPEPAASLTSVERPHRRHTSIRVGILSFRNASFAYQRYRPLLDYLADEIGQDFALVPLSPTSQFEEVAAHELDLVITNPLAAVQLHRLYDAEFVITQKRLRTGTQFGGQIVVKRSSPIETLEDLRGQRVACVNFQTAAGGCVFQIHHLLQRGIDPHTDFASFIELSSQNNIVLGLLNGSLDAGFVRTGQLKQMAANGLIEDTSTLRVLEPQQDSFPHPHTTSLYPEWAVLALRRTSPRLTSLVKDRLLALPPEHSALAAAQLEGFVPVADYSQINLLIEQLRLKGWDVK